MSLLLLFRPLSEPVAGNASVLPFDSGRFNQRTYDTQRLRVKDSPND